jgi:hypothetical protein
MALTVMPERAPSWARALVKPWMPDLAAAGHPVPDRFSHVEAASKIGVDHLLPLLVIHALHGGVAGDAGIVDQHADRPKLGLDLAHPLLAGVIVRHVPFERPHARAVGKGARPLLVARVVGGNGQAHLLKRDADRLADAARSARDDCNLCHVLLLLRGKA